MGGWSADRRGVSDQVCAAVQTLLRCGEVCLYVLDTRSMEPGVLCSITGRLEGHEENLEELRFYRLLRR